MIFKLSKHLLNCGLLNFDKISQTALCLHYQLFKKYIFYGDRMKQSIGTANTNSFSLYNFFLLINMVFLPSSQLLMLLIFVIYSKVFVLLQNCIQN